LTSKKENSSMSNKNKEGGALKATAWRMPTDEKNEYLYHLQVRGRDKRQQRKLLRILKEWKNIAFGWNPKDNKEFMLLFSKCFNNSKDWVSWAKTFPFELQELNPLNDKPKKIKLGLASQQTKRGRPRKKVMN